MIASLVLGFLLYTFWLGGGLVKKYTACTIENAENYGQF